MSIAIWAPIAVATACAMEGWAALLHGRVWHGALLPIHRSHHRKRLGTFEANDLLSALHAPIAIALILYGSPPRGALGDVAFGLGIGMTLFGLAYLLVHDGFVHRRLPMGVLARFAFFRAIRDAHRTHHGRGRAPYGFFLGPSELRRHARRPAREIAPNERSPKDRARASRRGRPQAASSTSIEGT
jgi:beta-carotene 3-hydroxylase